MAGTNVSLTGVGIALGANVTGGTTSPDTVGLNATTGTISQSSGAITGFTLTALSTGGTTLNDANQVTDLGTSTNSGAGGFTLNDNQALTVTGPVNAGTGSLSLTSAGLLSVDAALTAGTNVSLTAGGAISQNVTGTITAAGLNAKTESNSGGSITLTDAGNAVGQATLTSLNTAGTVFAGGAIAFVDGVPLTIVKFSATEPGVATTGSIQIATTGASMTVATGATVTGGVVEIGLPGATDMFTNDGQVIATGSGGPPGGDVVILANLMSLSGGTIAASNGAVVLGPFTTTFDVTLGGTASSTILALGQTDLASITAALTQI